jgi:hypothetical protein
LNPKDQEEETESCKKAEGQECVVDLNCVWVKKWGNDRTFVIHPTSSSSFYARKIIVHKHSTAMMRNLGTANQIGKLVNLSASLGRDLYRGTPRATWG